MNADHFLRFRVPGRVRDRFEVLARNRGETPSSLLRQLINEALADTGDPARLGAAEVDGAATRSDRLTVRLRPGDAQRLRVRAGARGTKPSTYLALLVRAHLRANSPLPQPELIEVKRALAEVAAVSRALRLGVPASAAMHGSDATSLDEVLRRIEQARGAIASLVQANIASWENDLA